MARELAIGHSRQTLTRSREMMDFLTDHGNSASWARTGGRRPGGRICAVIVDYVVLRGLAFIGDAWHALPGVVSAYIAEATSTGVPGFYGGTGSASPSYSGLAQPRHAYGIPVRRAFRLGILLMSRSRVPRISSLPVRISLGFETDLACGGPPGGP